MEICISNSSEDKVLQIKDLTVLSGDSITTALLMHFLYMFMSELLILEYVNSISNDPDTVKEFTSMLPLFSRKQNQSVELGIQQISSYINKLMNNYCDFVLKRLLQLSEFTGTVRISFTVRFSDSDVKHTIAYLKGPSKTNQISTLEELFLVFILFNMGSPFVFPAERVGLLSFPIHINMGSLKMEQLQKYVNDAVIEQIIKKQNNIDFQKILFNTLQKFKTDYGYPYFSTGFINFLVSVMLKTRVNHRDEKLYKELKEMFETTLMKGKAFINDRNRIMYQSFSKNTMDIAVAPLHIKNLASFDLYLQHGFEDVLLIECPEMGLTTEQQFMLAEFINILVNRGIKVIINTQSNYMLARFLNLLKGEQHNTEPLIFECLENKKFKKVKPHSDVFVSREQFSAYLFADGEITDVLQQDTADIQLTM